MNNFTYDGVGVNDANDEHKRRVATLSADYMKPETGNLLAAAPELLKALEELAAQSERVMEALSRRGQGATLLGMAHLKAKRAIAKARGE